MTRVTADISVVICAYTFERWNDLIEAVASVQQQTTLPREIIVVIDHNPALAAQVRAHLADVSVIENREARGLSGARNSGIAVAQGAAIAFMDEDAVAASDWLERLAAGFDEPEIIGVGGAIEPFWLSSRPNWFPEEFDWVVGCTYRGMPLTSTSVRNLIGCNMSFKREVFEVVGGFRTGIGRVGTRPVGCEETELCIRVGQHWRNKALRYEPGAKVRHRVTASRSTWRYFRSRCYAEGLSKALVAQFVGPNEALQSERVYTLRTLPSGVVRNLKDLLLAGDSTGLLRALAIVAGLIFTTAGYARGICLERLGPRVKAVKGITTFRGEPGQ
ncbi:MAG: glycosyltransferase [Chloroflexota bacterium]|nr:glycosyltransferase [Chloroflexota bacterium]